MPLNCFYADCDARSNSRRYGPFLRDCIHAAYAFTSAADILGTPAAGVGGDDLITDLGLGHLRGGAVGQKTKAWRLGPAAGLGPGHSCRWG